MKKRLNYYQVLHVQPDAPLEIIRASYRTMMQKMRKHPDLGGNQGDAAAINEAYATLNNPMNRAAYDKARLKPEPNSRPLERTRLPAHRPMTTTRRCAFCSAEHKHTQNPKTNVFCETCKSPLLLATQAQLEDSCRRSINRFSNDQPLVFFTHWLQEKACTGRTNDISLNGMKLSSNLKLAKGQIIKIDSPALKAVARVTNCRRQDVGWGVGVQFISLYFEHSRGSFIEARA
jgi:curved DNA-binding protein CbpA